ncbi:MAG TPA: hypothetical protein VN033_15060 [Vulgatibacter sp.]|nr:hypothetical protein [Vulgatibacter sp.]
MGKAGITVEGQAYELRVLQVLEKNEFGKPTVVKILRDEDSVRLEDGEEFVTAFVHGSADAPPAATT